MNESTEQKLTLKANFIGPVLKLSPDNALLSSNKQNFVFATNGTGKSFLARSLRMLDESTYDAQEDKNRIPTDLVSQENQSGDFSISLGDECIGRLKLDKINNEVQRSSSSYLFHVFTSDYIETELRQKEYNLDGNIEHEIILGRDNSKIDQKKEQLLELKSQLITNKNDLLTDFDASKDQLKKTFEISANLAEFKNLTFERCTEIKNLVAEEVIDLAKLQSDYETYKSLPNEPELPVETTANGVFFDFEELDRLVSEEISISTVTEEVKNKIAIDSSFFQTGVERYRDNKKDCHFCGQELKESAIELIEKYVEYFQDKEAKAKESIIGQKRSIGNAIAAIERSIKESLVAQSNFDELKQYFPSKKEIALENVVQDLESLKITYSDACKLLDEKLKNIPLVLTRDNDDEYRSQKNRIGDAISRNKKSCEELSKLASKSDGERLSIQRQTCRFFAKDFFRKNECEFQALLDQGVEIKNLTEEIRELELVSGNSVPARSKVVDTFIQLLNFMFGGKYQFDSDRFVVQLGNTDIKRGGDKTFSDGEKSVLAFCYFLAQSHMRVESKEDYQRIFYIIDDPVSSLSFDYVYCIAQCLKNLRVTEEGIQFNSSASPRPRMLVFTHNDYFYNVAVTNNIFRPKSFFQLTMGDANHKIEPLEGYISPHKHHLKHVYEVSTGLQEPSYSTPNSIRAVLEGLWKFLSPDLKDLPTFITKVISKHTDIQIRSILINDLSHGGKSNDLSPVLSDIRQASQGVIEVVQSLAPGQIKQIQ